MEFFADFAGWIRKGGPVMWPILISSIYGTALCVERWLFYSAQGKMLAQRWTEVEHLAEYAPPQPPSGGSLADRMSSAIILSGGLDHEHRMEKIQVAFVDQTAEIEKHLNVVSVIGTLLPMLGLLGTIGGMISAFKGIAEHGAGDPKYVADGIAKALVATASGLVTAIPLIYLHQVLANRADALSRKLDEFSTHITHIAKTGRPNVP